MHSYVVLAKPGSNNHFDTTLFVKEGFSIWAFIFSGFWLLYKKLWWQGGIVLFIQIFIFSTLLNAESAAVILLDLMIKLWIGFSGMDWVIKERMKKDFSPLQVMVCGSKREAELRFFAEYLEKAAYQTQPPVRSSLIPA